MKLFLRKFILFWSLFLAILLITAMCVPNIAIKNLLYYALLDKHEMLKKAKSQKLIFVGGSGIGYGLNSKRISEVYKVGVVNLGIHAGFGLKYILNDIKPFIKKGDIVIVVPEYEHFLNVGFADGDIELLNILFDVYPEGKKYIRFKQWIHLLKFLPVYACTKAKNYFKYGIMSRPVVYLESPNIQIYYRKAFNKYGDAVAHWNMKTLSFPATKLKGEPDTDLIYFLNKYNDFVKSKSARLYFAFPAFQESSYDASLSFINQLKDELNRKLTIEILSSPERYRLPNNLFFDTPYHTIKEGVDIRTQRIIEDLMPVFSEVKLPVK